MEDKREKSTHRPVLESDNDLIMWELEHLTVHTTISLLPASTVASTGVTTNTPKQTVKQKAILRILLKHLRTTASDLE